MNFETLQKLDKLQTEIEQRAYERQKPKSDEWEHCDVLVRGKANERTRHWGHVPPQSLDYHISEPRRRVVITRYARELIWLFEQLKAIHPGDIERISDHDFYGLLADEANLYLEQHKQSATASRLLEAMINKVKDIYR